MRTAIIASTISLIFVALLAGSVVPAHASFNYERVGDFGSFGIWHDGLLSNPQHIAEDSDGNLYITDLGNRRIQKFDSQGEYLDQWGSSGKGDGQFREPAGIAVGNNLAYVVDRALHRVQVFDLNGTYITQWGERGSENGQFNFPTVVSSGINGTVYVADSGNQRIQIFSENGEFINSVGKSGFGKSEFLHISYVVTDREGNVYGVDRGHGKIEKFDSQGNYVQTMWFDAAADIWAFSPLAMAVAPDNSMFILNSADGKILHLQPDDYQRLTVHQRLGPFGNFLSLGTDLLLSDSGHLYVVDSLGHKVFKYNTPFVQKPASPVTTHLPDDPVKDMPDGAGGVLVHNYGNTTAVFDACDKSMDFYNVIMGTDDDDILEGTNRDDLIFALGGDDIVFGYAGNDCIFGGTGNDIIFGNDGSDGIFGDQGNDILKGSAGNDILYGNYGLDSIDGGTGNDICIAADTTDQDLISNCER